MPNLSSIITPGNVATSDNEITLTNKTLTDPIIQYVAGDTSFTVPAGTTGERPSSPGIGELRFNTDEGSLEQYDGTEWISVGKTDQEVRNLLSAGGDLTYNSSTGEFTVNTPDLILTPENIAPADNATGTVLPPELEASDYGSLYGVPMASAQWQISEVEDFATTVVDETVAGTSTTFTPSSNLDTLTNYFWRVRYTDDNGEDQRRASRAGWAA